MKYKFLKQVLQYAWSHKLISAVALYSMIALCIRIQFNIDLGIPCLWKTCFDFECPGCGLTTAFMHLLQLDAARAYESNPLVFLIAPAGIMYIWNDFRKFTSAH